MKLYISERFLSQKDKAAVTDEGGNIRYYVRGDFAIAKKYCVEDTQGRELASVLQKKISSTGTCVINRNGKVVAEIVPKITLIKPKYAVKGFDWTIEGSFSQDKYAIKSNGETIVEVNVKLFTKGNAYEINISEGIDEVNAIASVLIIEGIFEYTVFTAAVQSAINTNH